MVWGVEQDVDFQVRISLFGDRWLDQSKQKNIIRHEKRFSKGQVIQGDYGGKRQPLPHT